MKLTLYSSCTLGNSINIDDKNFKELTENRRKEIALEVFEKLLERFGCELLLEDLIVQNNTDFMNLGICDSCGNERMHYVLEI